MPEYLLLLLVMLLVSVFLHPREGLFQYSWDGVAFFTVTAVAGFLFDWFCILRGHWSYNDSFMLGRYLWGVPLEDVLFMFIIPYFCIVCYRQFGACHGPE